MPRRVDHEERRNEIVDALLRLTVREGIEAVSVRNVAAELGCSTRPVQYFFADKAELLAAAHARVTERMTVRMRNAVRKLGPDPSPRAFVDAVVKSYLPVSPDARDNMVLMHVFYGAELTDERLRIPGATRVPKGLADIIADKIRDHHGGRAPRGVDVDKEALLLVCALPNLCSGVVAGYLKLADARSNLDYAIDRLLPA